MIDGYPEPWDLDEDWDYEESYEEQLAYDAEFFVQEAAEHLYNDEWALMHGLNMDVVLDIWDEIADGLESDDTV